MQILEVLEKTKKPLSQAGIISKLSKKGEVDRVSIYRNLLKLTEVGIVHQLSENSYVICSHECESHPHILMVCQSCSKHNEIENHDSCLTLFP